MGWIDAVCVRLTKLRLWAIAPLSQQGLDRKGFDTNEVR